MTKFPDTLTVDEQIDAVLDYFLAFFIGNQAIKASPEFARREARSAIKSLIEQKEVKLSDVSGEVNLPLEKTPGSFSGIEHSNPSAVVSPHLPYDTLTKSPDTGEVKTIDQVLEDLVVHTANQYGGYEGRDGETDRDIAEAHSDIE